MSEEATCDVCGKAGRRRRGYLAPDDWLFGESKHCDTGEVYVVWACSKTCASSFFRPGPLKYTTGTDKEPELKCVEPGCNGTVLSEGQFCTGCVPF